MFISWIGNLFIRKGHTYRHTSAKRKRVQSFHSHFEDLEARLVPTFLTPVAVATAASSAVVVVGDFNGDGKQDLVISNLNNTITTTLGNGNGTFQAAIISASTGNSWAMVTGDFNHDGKLDLAANANGGVSIDIILGNGDGTFQPRVSYVTGSYANRLATGDLNNDGFADVVGVSSVGAGSAFVLMNTGSGTGAFSPVQILAAGSGAADIKIADLDRDGKLDLVIANQNSAGGVNTMKGNGDGTFQAPHSYYASTAPYRETVGDFNNDGLPDVVVMNTYIGNQMTILLCNPDGTYGTANSYTLAGGTAAELDSADFNGDGNLDILGSDGKVELGRGDGSFYATQNYLGFRGNYLALGDFNGDGAPDAVITAGFGANATTMTNAKDDQTLVGSAVQLSLSAPATAVAGVAFPVTVTALDANGNVATNFLGTVGFSDPLNPAVASSYTFTVADAGVHTLPNGGMLIRAGVQTLSATSPLLPTASTTVTITPASAAKFQVTGPATATAGDPTSTITVTALDAFNNFAPSAGNTVHFTSTDAQAGLPADYTFTAADTGVHSFTATLRTSGTQTVTATDTVNANASGNTAGIVVTAGAAVGLSLSGGGGFINSPSVVAVYARDAFGNIAVTYSGAAHLTTSDPLATLPVDGEITNGVGFLTIIPRTLGNQTITATDAASGFSATETVLVTPGQGVSFTVTPVVNAVAGTAQAMKVTVYDAFGNISTVYRGSMLLSSSDPTVGGFYTFTAADAGVHIFTVALTRAGTQSVSVADTATPAMSLTQTGIVVTPAAAATIAVTPLVGTVAGVAQNVTITARDAYGNLATSYRGTLAFSSSDTQVAMLASYTFTAADAGVHTFSVTFKSSRGQTFTATDTVNAAMTYFQRDIIITPAAMTGFAFRVPSSATAGSAFSVTLTAVDAFGNPIIGYTGKVHFSGPAGIPVDYTFTAADAGLHVFTITFSATGTQTIGVQDTLSGALKGQTSVKVATGGGGTGGGGTGGGGKKV
jgi:hypothetical protein